MESLDENKYSSINADRNISSKSVSDSSSVDLIQSLDECQQISQLIFGNHLNEALRRTKEQFVEKKKTFSWNRQ